MVNAAARCVEAFAEHFGRKPEVLVRSPGRVNLIGDHTDYNEGFVMPAATQQAFWLAASRRNDDTLAARSEVLDRAGQWSLHEPAPRRRGCWSSYVRGVAAVLREAGYTIRGTNLLIAGDLPVGAGLSSSAALEVGVAIALLAAGGTAVDEVDRPALARLCQRAEHRYAGVPCGIMDQYCCLMGRKDHAVMLDCRAVRSELIPLPQEWRIVIMDTQVRRELAAGEYAARQADCRRAVEQASAALGRSVQSLRDLDEPTLQSIAGELDETALRRARHVIRENARVLAAAEAFRRADSAAAGKIMLESHASLRDDYEVSCAELDRLVEIAAQTPGVFGARMTGGGFGGCAVAIADADGAERLKTAVLTEYNRAAPRPARVLLTGCSNGAQRCPID